MSKLDDLNAKADELQSALDAEQAQIQAAIDALTQTVADLTAQLGGVASDADLQAVIDKLTGTIADLQGTVPDTPTG